MFKLIAARTKPLNFLLNRLIKADGACTWYVDSRSANIRALATSPCNKCNTICTHNIYTALGRRTHDVAFTQLDRSDYRFFAASSGGHRLGCVMSPVNQTISLSVSSLYLSVNPQKYFDT